MKTFKLLLIIGITAFNLTTAFTQTHVNREWMTEFGYPDTLAWSKTIQFDHKLLHVGNSLDTNQNVEMLITLTDLEGNIEWQENYSETSNSNDYGVAIDFDDFGNIYVVGTTDNGGQDQDIVLLKYNDSGQLQWSFTYDSPYGLDDVGTDLTLDGDGMIYVCGTSQGNATDLDYVTFCYYTNDEFVWVERYDYNDLIDVPIGIEYQASTGEVTVTGASASATNRWDYAFVSHDKTNGNLTNITRQPLSTIGFDMPTDVVTHHEGNIYVTGRSSNDGINYDIRTVKLDSAYNIIWSEKFDFQGGFDIGHSIEVDSSGNVYVGGSVTRANNVEEMILIKYDKTGSELWHHVQASEDFTQPAYVKDITVSAHGDLYFLGEEFSNENLSRLVIGKIDSTGKTRWQRRTNQGIHEHPISIQWYDDTVLYINSALEIGGGEHVYKTRKYAQFTQDASITYEQDTIPVYRSKELIVRFKQNAINVDAIDNLLGKKTEFAPLEYYISPQAMQTIDNAIEGTCDVVDKGPNRCGITAVKIFKQLTSDIDSTIARNGEKIRVPNFWTTLLLNFPESVDLDQARSALNGLTNYVAYVENNVIIEPTSLIGVDDEYFVDEYQRSLHDEWNFHDVQNPDDPTDSSWSVSILMEDAWEVYPEAGKPEIKCGVVDLLTDFRHPDFGYDSDEGPSSTKVRGGYDYVTGTPLFSYNLADSNTWHGTEAAGIIGALRNNDDEGIAGIAGGDAVGSAAVGSPTYFDDKGISLYSQGIYDYSGSGQSLPQPIQSVYDALVMGATHTGNGGLGLDIMNNSWEYPASFISGVNDTNYVLLKESIQFANRAQVSQVAARGNIGEIANPSEISYPACMDDDWIMNVSGTGLNGNYPYNDLPTIQGPLRPKVGNGVDFAAPMRKELIYTTLSTHAPANLFGDPYTSFSQTSAAAPHVSGAVGLLMSYLNGTISGNSNLAPEDAERILELTANNYDNMGQYSDSVGWGKINVGAAFRLVEQPYASLHHLSANQKALNFEANRNIYIREPVQNDSNIWFSTGTYNANVYRLDGWRNHSHLLNDEDTIVAYWARPSASDVFEEAISDSLLPRHRLTIDHLDKDSCHMHGFIYEILDAGGNTIGWLPNDTTLTKWNFLELKYTVLMRDSLAPVANVKEQEKEQFLSLYPNPSTDFQTVKINGFANQNVSITLYDIQGRSFGTLYEGKLEGENAVFEFDISHLSNGMYLYDVRMDTERKALRFIKQ